MPRPHTITFEYGECPPPATPVISGPSAICPNSTGAASIAAQTGATYLWAISGGSIVSGGTTPTVTFSAGSSGSVSLSVTVTATCGSQAGANQTIPLYAPPTATVSGGTTITSGGSAVVHVALTGTSPWSITWSDGLTQNGITGTSWDRTVTPSQTTTYSVTAVSDGHCAGTSSGSATITVQIPPPPTPTNLVATGTSSSAVTVSWGASAGADSYEVVRMDAGGSTTIVVAGASLSDVGLPSNAALLYKVRAVKGSGANAVYSGYSNVDLATTVIFTPLVAQQSTIAMVHFQEMLTAVNAARSLAGLPPVSFSPAAGIGGIVYMTQLTGLRSGLNGARSALGLPVVSYGETIVAGTTIIKRAQIEEIRGGVR